MGGLLAAWHYALKKDLMSISWEAKKYKTRMLASQGYPWIAPLRQYKFPVGGGGKYFEEERLFAQRKINSNRSGHLTVHLSIIMSK